MSFLEMTGPMLRADDRLRVSGRPGVDPKPAAVPASERARVAGRMRRAARSAGRLDTFVELGASHGR